MSRHGECPDCGLAVAKSLLVAAGRVRDPECARKIGLGVDMQAWGTLISLAACICGPLLYSGPFAYGVFGLVVSAVLGVGSTLVLMRARKPGYRTDYTNMTAAAVGSWSIVIPALVLRMATTGESFRAAILITLLVGAVFWFVSECSKLHLLEQWAVMYSSMDVRQRARNLRWGIYAALGTVAAGLIPPAIGGLSSVNYLTVQFVLTICVALLVFSLMGAMLQGKLSKSLQQQAGFAIAVKAASAGSETVQLDRSQMQVVWGHPPRWSSF